MSAKIDQLFYFSLSAKIRFEASIPAALGMSAKIDQFFRGDMGDNRHTVPVFSTKRPFTGF